jgi:hypothetical protein
LDFYTLHILKNSKLKKLTKKIGMNKSMHAWRRKRRAQNYFSFENSNNREEC